MSTDKLYKKLYNIKNIKLAWKRLIASQNINYKNYNYYRELFLAYELKRDLNLKKLSERIKGHSYNPQKILRFYVPKSTGLHRPITFLQLDDLIVYQAMANIIANRFRDKRKEVENNYVFSNVLNHNKNYDVYFFKKWQEGYKKFIHEIKAYYSNGNTWVAHFDLAAYYDTISHGVLVNQISKIAYPDFKSLLKKCLETWTTNKSQKIDHGIPQGPIASNLIGEIYLLPIDIALKAQRIKYVRYVDDIKIFGKSRKECLEGAIFLEKECKERGLIPQSKKYKVLKAEKIEDAIGKFPSLSVSNKNAISSNPSKATMIFKDSFNENKFDISKVRYILKVSGKNDKILNIVLKNLNQYPDLTPEFCQFLLNYSFNSEIGEKIFNVTLKSPSECAFVEGKYWELLSSFSVSQDARNNFNQIAIERLKQSRKNPEKPALRLGIYKFLASSGNCLVIPWLKNEKYAFIQMLVVPYIHYSCYDNQEFLELVNWFLRRTSFEPALVSIKQLLFSFNSNIIQMLDKPKKAPSGVLNNILEKSERIDSIGQILKNRYKISYFNKWRKFLGKDYNHANEILHYANKSYYVDKSVWVNYTDSFNDIMIRKFVILLKIKRPKIAWPKIVNKNNENIDFGVIMNENNKLSTQYPKIVDKFRIFHKRRIKTPASHAFDKKSGKPASIVTSREQKKLSNYLKNAYEGLIAELNKLL